MLNSNEWIACDNARTAVKAAIEAVRACNPAKAGPARIENDARLNKLLEVLSSLDRDASTLLRTTLHIVNKVYDGAAVTTFIDGEKDVQA